VGDRAGGDAPPREDGAREPDGHDDVARIAGAVREVVAARAALISRVVDDDWLEVVAVAGQTSGRELTGHRWRRADLTRYLDDAEQLGRLHVTTRRAVSYVEVPEATDFDDDGAVLLAPLRSAHGELVGVLGTVGPVEVDDLAPGACDLVELYADQARLALDLLHEHHLLVEHLRLSDGAQTLLHRAVDQPDVPALLASLAPPLAEMMEAGGVWTCAEVASGAHAEAASYPEDVAGRLGADICTLVEPMVDTCWNEDTTLTDEDSPLLGRLAGLAHQERALLAAIGSGTSVRGALLVMRGDDEPWTRHERDALASLGRRLGAVVEQLETRRRDRHLVDELRELDRYRRDLVASITHDLKTPLTAIALNAELLESDRRLAEAGAHPVAAIRRSAERLSGLVDDLLALARTEEGGSGDDTDTDLVALVRDACRHSEVDAQQRGITLALDLPPTLHAAVDADALGRVYVNVISNAVKYSLPDGEVRVALRTSGDTAELVCADDGIGISEEDQAGVFDMFRRSRDVQARGVPGSGVGLAIAHRIMTRLGGGIDVTSTLGHGSTFTVRIPVSPH
jgi:signal transduction histidine kinase